MGVDALEQYKENLRTLESQAALYGMTPPLELLNNIKFHKQKIKELEQEIKVKKAKTQSTRRTERSSEVDAYIFIKADLKARGWDTRNPHKHPAGQVYTQNECLAHPEIGLYLGLRRPEYVVKITETVFWVVEAKRSHNQIDQAVSEAEDYARDINKSSAIQVKFISGVAGNETDGYLVQTKFLVGSQFKHITINDKVISALIQPEVARRVLEFGPNVKDLPIDEGLFLSKAERINEILHLGAINKEQRARVMAALLLALIDDTPPNIDAPPSVLINDINGRARNVLNTQGKSEFLPYINITLPATEDNHLKFKRAIVQTIQELNNLNIRSAMNSGADVLGKFYEVFLKYGNGAKEIGIVLTPRHITSFAVDVLGISHQDIVYDPTCGTGGFLVAALDYVRRTSNEAQMKRFKQFSLFGVDQDPGVVALAIVNMIFRGDGKTNIIEGNCFQKNLVKVNRGNIITATYSNVPPAEEELVVTKVLMNPPFALPSSAEKEFKFVDAALQQMQDGGILFAILPYSAMIKPSVYKRWREYSLLANHTLLSVITLPYELFIPVDTDTVGIFVKKGIPHPRNQNVLWIRAIHDGLLKVKVKRLPDPRETDDFSKIRDTVRAFLLNPTMPVQNIEKFQKSCPIDFSDPLLELVPENYLDQPALSEDELQAGMEHVVRDVVAFIIRTGREL